MANQTRLAPRVLTLEETDERMGESTNGGNAWKR